MEKDKSNKKKNKKKGGSRPPTEQSQTETTPSQFVSAQGGSDKRGLPPSQYDPRPGGPSPSQYGPRPGDFLPSQYGPGPGDPPPRPAWDVIPPSQATMQPTPFPVSSQDASSQVQWKEQSQASTKEPTGKKNKQKKTFDTSKQKSTPPFTDPKKETEKTKSEFISKPELSTSSPATGKGKTEGKNKKKEAKQEKENVQAVPDSIKAISESFSKMSKSTEDSSYIIPRRKEFLLKHTSAYVAKTFSLEVNFLEIKMKDLKLKVYHYDVAFNPDKPKSLYKAALKKLLNQYVPNRAPAFDGKKNVYVGGSKLSFPAGDTLRDTVKVLDPERNVEKEFDVTIKLVNQNLNLEKLVEYIKNGTSYNSPQDVIQATDIALRQAPMNTFISVGRSFFAPTNNATDLGGGMELWPGFYQSAVMCWKPYLNIDVANKGFPTAGPVLEFLKKDCRASEQEMQQYGLNDYQLRDLSKFIKGIKVEYKVGPTKRYEIIGGLGRNAIEEKLKDSPDKMSVEQYFRRNKGITLRFPRLPLLSVLRKPETLLPIEFCEIAKNQVLMRKLDERQTASMVRAAARPTDERKDRIMQAIARANYNSNPTLKEFKMEVSNEFTKVNAHVLRPPQIAYQNSNVDVRNGVWKMEKFINGIGLRSWTIVNADGKINDGHLKNLEKNFQIAGRSMGFPVEPYRHSIKINPRSESDYLRAFNECLNKCADLQLIVVVMGFRNDSYGTIKRAAEIQGGFLTQCLKSNTVDFRKMNAMTATNILLKINSKLGGVNHTLEQTKKPQILKRPIMIVGADVTHPAPGSDGSPSIAAVAASHDKYGFQYNMVYKLQSSRREMIDQLEQIIVEQLEFFKKKTNWYPEKIVYYRDGVSEGQFHEILRIELRAIRAACKRVGASQPYQPGITFLVVQKRHHTRFFPDTNNSDGSRNKNVVAGTLVDSEITHPTELDFYLGTARPTKYHLLWDDNNMQHEELEQLTYYLCHMFSRCNRSVSYPAPTYYAHLGAFRARAYWDGQRIDMTNLNGEQQRRGTIQNIITQNTPMFFS